MEILDNKNILTDNLCCQAVCKISELNCPHGVPQDLWISQILTTSTILSFIEKAFDQNYWRKVFKVYVQDVNCWYSVRTQ